MKMRMLPLPGSEPHCLAARRSGAEPHPALWPQTPGLSPSKRSSALASWEPLSINCVLERVHLTCTWRTLTRPSSPIIHFVLKKEVIGLGPPLIQCDLTQLDDNVCEGPISCKVTFTGPGGWDQSPSFRGTQLKP